MFLEGGFHEIAKFCYSWSINNYSNSKYCLFFKLEFASFVVIFTGLTWAISALVVHNQCNCMCVVHLCA